MLNLLNRFKNKAKEPTPKKLSMQKPGVFIGSSTAGLRLAQAVKANISSETETDEPTVWKDKGKDLFSPGTYIFETLEEQKQKNHFAILIATPDDRLTKKGQDYDSMRDNILLEFGFFVGAFGRKRTFLLVPRNKEIAIPSDLSGINFAKYDDSRIREESSEDEIKEVVKEACSKIMEAICKEWTLMKQQAENAKIRNELLQAIKNLRNVSRQLQDELFEFPGDAFKAFSDRTAFDKFKAEAIKKVDKIANSYQYDAKQVGVEAELSQLTNTVKAALKDLPFPEELEFGENWFSKFSDILKKAISSFTFNLKSGVQAVENEFLDRISKLRSRYSEWWSEHSKLVRSAATELDNAINSAHDKAWQEMINS